jgi:23S rRNA pseudouridine1911/1915/1917 synthase
VVRSSVAPGARSDRIVTADRGDAGVRLDLVLRRHLTDVDEATRTQVQAWIENGHVTVNGVPVHRTAARAAAGDVVTVSLPEPAPRTPMAAEAVPLNILYEDEYLLAVDKPAGVVVHPSYKNTAGTVLNALLWHARGWPAGERPSLVGRLDKGTSGILIVARTAAIHAALQRTMASGETEKDYLVVVYGRVKIARGEIALRLGPDPLDRRRMVASSTTGAPSLTQFQRLASVKAPDAGLSLLRCRLMTGRTHQIRAHLTARNWPPVGDAVYGGPRWKAVVDPVLADALRAFPRQALHAWRLAFTHPVTRRPMLVEAPIPADIEGLLTAAGLVPHDGTGD